MTTIQSHRDLIAWQKSMDLVETVYQLTKLFPDEEKFGLTSQLRRCIVSVPSNIAEGHGRGSRKDYAQFVSIAKGSLMEAETQLLIAVRLGYLESSRIEEVISLIREIEKMLSTLRRKLLSQNPS